MPGVVAVERLEKDDLVAGLEEGEARRHERARRADGDHDLIVAADRHAVEVAGLLGDLGAQLRDAGVGRVDRLVAVDGGVGTGLDRVWRGEVADALPEVDAVEGVDGEGNGADVGLAEGVGAGGEGLHRKAELEWEGHHGVQPHGTEYGQ